MTPGDRIIVTMPRSAPREGEYVEDRGSRARVLLDGDTETCVVLRERVKPDHNAPFVAGVTVARAKGVSTAAVVAVADAAMAAGTITPNAYLSALRAVPKPPKPWRSEAYRAFVRTWPCCCCGRVYDIEAHHHGPHAMGEKGDDSTCVPLSRDCHRAFHDRGTFKRSMSREETDRIARRAQIECLRIWYMQVDLDADAVIVDALIAHLRESKT